MPPDRERAFESGEPSIECEFAFERLALLRVGVDVTVPLVLHPRCVRTGLPRHEWQQALSLQLCRVVIQHHGEPADRARDAVRHPFDSTDALIEKAARNDRRLVDAGAALRSEELVRAPEKLSVQDVIEVAHGG